MKLIRRLLFIPVSAIVAVAVGFGWAAVFPNSSFSERDLLYSVIGMSPRFLGRVIPVAVFVVLGATIAPGSGRITIPSLGILGGLYGLPFGPIYEEWTGGPIFYAVEGCGALLGAGSGMLIAFAVVRRRKIRAHSSSSTSPLPKS